MLQPRLPLTAFAGQNKCRSGCRAHWQEPCGCVPGGAGRRVIRCFGIVPGGLRGGQIHDRACRTQLEGTALVNMHLGKKKTVKFQLSVFLVCLYASFTCVLTPLFQLQISATQSIISPVFYERKITGRIEL